MKVLSLFDGMACGMLAMQKAEINVERYVAYEIDKYAVQTSTHNFPMIEHKGDVFKADFTEYEGFDFIVGGSPCTYWSIAQSSDKRETTASGLGWNLFSQYVRAVQEAKPRFFIYENNYSMSKQIRASIDEAFGFEAVLINSSLVSAQNRKRLYWVGKRNVDGTYSKVDVRQPDDIGILLRDILETTTSEKYYSLGEAIGFPDSEKSFALTTRCALGAVPKDTLEKRRHQMIAEPVCLRMVRTDEGKALRKQYEAGEIHHGFNEHRRPEPREDGKTNTLSTVLKDNPICEPVYAVTSVPSEKRIRNHNAFLKQQAEPVRIGTIENDAKNKNFDSQQYRVYSPDGKSVTICGQGGGLCAKTGLYAVPTMPVREATKSGICHIDPMCCVDMEQPNSKTRRGRKMDEKSNCLTTSPQFYQYLGTKDMPIYEVCNGMITIKDKQYPIKLQDGFYIIRKLTVLECMRLQTVPDWYVFPVSNTQAYKMLGNGWTVDVIAHIINE